MAEQGVCEGVVLVLQCEVEGEDTSGGALFEIVSVAADTFTVRAMRADLRPLLGDVPIPRFDIRVSDDYAPVLSSQWTPDMEVRYFNPTSRTLCEHPRFLESCKYAGERSVSSREKSKVLSDAPLVLTNMLNTAGSSDMTRLIGIVLVLSCQMQGVDGDTHTAVPFEVTSLSVDGLSLVARPMDQLLRAEVGEVNVPIFSVDHGANVFVRASEWNSEHAGSFRYLNTVDMQVYDSLWFEPPTQTSLVTPTGSVLETPTVSSQCVETMLVETLLQEVVALYARAEVLHMLKTSIEALFLREGLVGAGDDDEVCSQRAVSSNTIRTVASTLVCLVVHSSVENALHPRAHIDTAPIPQETALIPIEDVAKTFDEEQRIMRDYSWEQYLHMLSSESLTNVSESSSIGDICRKNYRLFQLIELGCDLANTTVSRLAKLNVTPKIVPRAAEVVSYQLAAVKPRIKPRAKSKSVSALTVMCCTLGARR